MKRRKKKKYSRIIFNCFNHTLRLIDFEYTNELNYIHTPKSSPPPSPSPLLQSSPPPPYKSLRQLYKTNNL